MAENKPPRSRPQPPFRFRSPEELERSPIWQAIKKAYATAERMRERGLLPEFSPEMIERLRQAQPAEDSLVTELVRRAQELVREQREQAEEAERSDAGKPTTTEAPDSAQVEGAAASNTTAAATEVADSATITGPVESKQAKSRRGRRLMEIPFIDEVIADLVQKHPKVRDGITEWHINRVIQDLRDRGVKTERTRNEDGSINENQKQTIRRRIKGWLDCHPLS
jgi:hypothetical protein